MQDPRAHGPAGWRSACSGKTPTSFCFLALAYKYYKAFTQNCKAPAETPNVLYNCNGRAAVWSSAEIKQMKRERNVST